MTVMLYNRVAVILFFTGISALSWTQVRDTVTLRPGPDEGKDVQLHTWYANTPCPYTPDICAVAWTSGGEPLLTRSIFEFDLSFLENGDSVISARLSLWANPISGHWQGHQGDNECYIRRILEEWNENTVTWNSQPASTTLNEVIIPQSFYSTQNYLDIPVTQLVMDMVKDPANSHGFMLSLVTEELYRSMVFSSSDHPEPERWPQLEIIYMSCTPLLVNFTYDVDDFKAYFTDLSTNATAWYWTFGDGGTSHDQHPVHVYASNGQYEVCLEGTNECGTAVYCDSIHVCELPVSGFGYRISTMTLYLEDSSQLTDHLRWDFGDGQFSELSDPTHVYADTGFYMICQRVWNECGEDSLCKTIHVVPKDDTVSDDPYLFVLYPNPAFDFVYLVSSASGSYEISFYKQTGEIVWKEKLHFMAHRRKEFYIAGFQEAIYMIRVEGKDFVWNGKLVVIKD